MMAHEVPSLLADTDLGKIGPCMRALAPRQRNFVWALFQQGDRDATAAARKAGYKDGSGIRNTAYQLWHDEKIQAAIHEEGRRRLNGMVPFAIAKMTDIMEDPQSDKAVVLKGVNMVLDRAGLHSVSERKVTHEHSMSDPGMLEKIRLLAVQLGVDPEKLLGARLAKQQPAAIEAEYQEVRQPTLEDFL